MENKVPSTRHRIFLYAIITVCAVVYVAGCWLFREQLPALYKISGLAVEEAPGWVVLESYRNFASLNAASAASVIGALAVMALGLPRQGWVLPLLYVASLAMLTNDILINADILELDHFATGLLRYDEDSLLSVFFALIVTPFALLLTPFSFGKAPIVLNRAGLRFVSPIPVLIAILLMAVSGLLLVPQILGLGLFDDRSFHSVMGLGSWPLYGYVWVMIVLKGATRAGPRPDRPGMA